MLSRYLEELFSNLSSLLMRVVSWRRACLWRSLGCLAVVWLLLLGLCGLLFWGVRRAAAQYASQPLSVMLLVDNSHSMFEKDGLGSDPELLRLDAARLFISYLGVDDGRITHEAGILFFGTDAELVVPLTRLDSQQRREEIFDLLQEPPRMGWTDQVQALNLGMRELEGSKGHRAVVLLTDGKPEWRSQPTLAEQHAYRETLLALGEQLAEADIPLFIILLANDVTDADPDIAAIWQPVWEAMTEATAPGRFYVAREAGDLVGIYHDVVLALTGGQTAGPVVRATVPTDGLRETVYVEPNLERVTFVISKSTPDIAVEIHLPNGDMLQKGMPGVRHAGRTAGREEVWVVDYPISGRWRVSADGVGQVTVWKDYRPAAVPTETPTLPPAAPATPRPTSTPIPTATPSPRLSLAGFPETHIEGEPLVVAVDLENWPQADGKVLLSVVSPTKETTSQQLFDDGRVGDVHAGDGRYGGQFTPREKGNYLVTVALQRDGVQLAQLQTRLTVQGRPALRFALSDKRPRVNHNLTITADWDAGSSPLVVERAWASLTYPSGMSNTVQLGGQTGSLLTGETPLIEEGAVEIVVHVQAHTADGRPVLLESHTPVTVRAPLPLGLLLGVMSVCVCAASLLAYPRWARSRPRLSGVLRIQDGPRFEGGVVTVDLDALSRTAVTLGGASADLKIRQTHVEARLQAAKAETGQDSVTLSGPETILLNARPLTEAQELFDRDIIQLGETRLRYENLLRRRHTAGRQGKDNGI